MYMAIMLSCIFKVKRLVGNILTYATYAWVLMIAVMLFLFSKFSPVNRYYCRSLNLFQKAEPKAEGRRLIRGSDSREEGDE